VLLSNNVCNKLNTLFPGRFQHQNKFSHDIMPTNFEIVIFNVYNLLHGLTIEHEIWVTGVSNAI